MVAVPAWAVFRIERLIPGRGTIAITGDGERVWTVRAPAADGTKRGMVRAPKIWSMNAGYIRRDGVPSMGDF